MVTFGLETESRDVSAQRPERGEALYSVESGAGSATVSKKNDS
jgi:hypothetical protein